MSADCRVTVFADALDDHVNKMLFQSWHVSAAVALCAFLLAGCGGGGSSSIDAPPPSTPAATPVAKITGITVFGDSLQDGGVKGYKYTVQADGDVTYIDRVAAAYGKSLCSGFDYASDNPYFMYQLKAGCTNFALAGTEVETRRSLFGWELDLSQQMSFAKQSTYSAGELVIVNGGGQDAAKYASAYLATQPGDSDAVAAFDDLFKYRLRPEEVEAALAAGPAAVTDMGRVSFKDMGAYVAPNIRRQSLERGASYLVVVNMPDITVTPRFQRALDALAARNGGGAAGAAVRARTQKMLRDWISAYNTELATQLAGQDRVLIVDLYQAFQQYAEMPGLFGLTNVTAPICPSTAAQGAAPAYALRACTADALSAEPPSGTPGGDWWKTYAFADDFHPSPYLHQLIAQRITLALKAKGWL